MEVQCRQTRGRAWFVAVFAGLACMIVGGVAGAAETAAGGSLTYSPARQGLPAARIWKSQIAFGDINGDGLPDIGAVSRLADGPHIWAGDGKGNCHTVDNGLPRESFCG